MSVAGTLSWRRNERRVEATADREEKLSHAQAVARLGNWEWTLATNELTWSDELNRLLGLPAGAPQTIDTFARQVHPDDRRMMLREMRRSVAENTEHALDFRVCLSDGSIRWLHGRGSVNKWTDSGEPAKVSGTAQDITARRRAEDDLRDTLSLLSATLDATADGILVVDLEGHITSVNQRFAELWRMPAAILEARDDDLALEYVVG